MAHPPDCATFLMREFRQTCRDIWDAEAEEMLIRLRAALYEARAEGFAEGRAAERSGAIEE